MKKIILYLIFFILLGSCINPSANKEDGFIVKDILDRKVLIPNQVNTVIGLRAGALRLLLYCGAREMITGIEELEKRPGRPYADAFPELKKLPVIGPPMGGDPELILKIKPDVIFITYSTVQDADALQKKTGIPVIAIECSEFATEKEKLFRSFRLIGSIIHKEERVDSLINYISVSINDLHERTNNIPVEKKPKGYIGGVPYSGSFGIISTQPYYPPFIFTNSINVASSIDQKLVSHVKGTFIDKEQLMQWNPDYLFIDQSGFEIVKKDLSAGSALAENLVAVKNNNMYTLYPYNNYATNYEMVLVNSWYVASVLYPDEFKDVDFFLKASEIITVFFGFNSKFAFHTDIFKRINSLND